MFNTAYNFKDNFERDLFYMLTESYDLKRFLLCSPYSSDPILNYGGILSKKHEEAFVKHLYVEGRKNIEENIIHDICSGGKSTIKIVGNKSSRKTTLIHNLSLLKNKKFGIISISKSGTTTEPALAFRLLKTQLEEQQGKEAAKRLIVCITDAKRGALRTLATQGGYKTYVIEDNIGGRFSVLSPVGLLPIACAGLDIKALIDGAASIFANSFAPSAPLKSFWGS